MHQLKPIDEKIDSQQLVCACNRDGCKGFFLQDGGVVENQPDKKVKGKNKRIVNSHLDLSEPLYVIRAISAWLLMGPRKLAILLAN